jgi:hypothetical protein
MQKQRRDFLKITAAGAAGLALARRADKAFAAWPGTGTLAVNPNIDNMRVVACQDSLMMKNQPTSMTFANENAAIDSARVQANMDAMAMQLANQPTADAAWKAIFRSSKAWAATKVAIKVNCIAPQNMASVCVVQKFCNIFAGFGVLPANIIIYDGNTTYGAGISNYNSYFSATDTTKTPGVVSSYNTALGGTISAAIPGGSPATATCTADIANGTIDILVNIANNKGHTTFGNATLTMKNHFGTFAPNHGAIPDYIFNINKSDAILGGSPVRQQLCFVDSLLANSKINTGNPDKMPNYLIMGVFGPAVDYLTCKKVREPSVAAGGMGCTNLVDATINSYVTSFGYTTADPVWVVVPPAGGGTGAGGAGGSGGSGGTGGGAGGTSASGGARSGGNSASGGAASGGNNPSGGAASGGNSASGGARSGGTSASGGAASGGNNPSGGVASGGTSASGGARSGGANGSGGAGSGGVTAAGGTASSGGTTSGGAGGTGGVATASASGGSTSAGGTSAGAGTGGANGTGGSSGSTVSAENSGSGCDIAGVDRRATRWGAMLAFGAVVAEKLRRLVSGSDQSS